MLVLTLLNLYLEGVADGVLVTFVRLNAGTITDGYGFAYFLVHISSHYAPSPLPKHPERGRGVHQALGARLCAAVRPLTRPNLGPGAMRVPGQLGDRSFPSRK